MTFTEAQIEDKAREIYLAKYAKDGGRWELVETKEVWREMARGWLAADEGTRAVGPVAYYDPENP